MENNDINDIHTLDKLLRNMFHTIRHEPRQDTRPAQSTMITMLRNVEIALSQPDDIGDFFAVVKSQYFGMFPPKCGLSEFYISREDPAEMRRLNAEYEKTKAQISEILNRH